MHMKQLKSTNVYFCIKIFRNQKFFIDYKHNYDTHNDYQTRSWFALSFTSMLKHCHLHNLNSYLFLIHKLSI